MGFECRLDHPADRVLVAHVDGHGRTADVVGHAFGLGTVQVGDDHVARTGGVRGAGDRLTDPRSGSGDDDDAVFEFHGRTVDAAALRARADAVRALR